MKRIMSLILSFVLAFSLCGCAASSNSSNTSSSTTTTEPTNYKDAYKLGKEQFTKEDYKKALEYFLIAYKYNKKAYKLYAYLYILYILLDDLSNANDIHIKALHTLSKENRTKYIDFITTIKDDNKLEKIEVPVNDTTPPEFTKFTDTINVDTGTTIDYNTYFTAKDDSEFTLSFDDSKVDINTAGEYTVTVSAKDKYENENKKDAKVVVSNPNYYLGLYSSAYQMNIRSEPSTSGTIVGSFVDGMQVYIAEVQKGSDGSLWGKLSTGYVCIQDSTTTYLSPVGYELYLDGIHSEFATACANAGLGGIAGRTMYTGNVNTTGGCDGQGVHANYMVVY